MPRHRIAIRLMDEVEDNSQEADRLLRVQAVIERLGEVQWVEPPYLHRRGGYSVCFTLPCEPDYDALFSRIEDEGYLPVI